MVRVNRPFSLIPITNYTFIITENSVTVITRTVGNLGDPTTVDIPFDGLRPFRNYVISVTAVNRAGNSQPTELPFTTAEAGMYVCT